MVMREPGGADVWRVDFDVVTGWGDHRWAEVGGWYADWSPATDLRAALLTWLETRTRLPDGQYRVTVTTTPEPASAIVDFGRAQPLSEPRRLDRHA
jgi:hypothetical protein